MQSASKAGNSTFLSESRMRRRLCLLQPVRHPHLAVHRRRGGEMLLRLLTLARAPVELAEAEVAVGDEGAHASLWPSVLIEFPEPGGGRQRCSELRVVNARLDP